MTLHPIPVIATMIDEALATHAFIGTVSSVTSGRVKLIRAGQTTIDPTSYVALTGVAATLLPGDLVSVIGHGASWLVVGKIDTTASGIVPVPPPVIPVPSTASGLYLGVYAGPRAPGDGALFSFFQFETDVGKNQAIMHIFSDWTVSIDGGLLSQINSQAHAVPLITWNPDATISLASIIAGDHDAYITAQAHILDTFGHAVFLRLMPDMNVNTVAWSGDPGLYVAAWIHIHDLIVAVAKRVAWVWSPSVWSGGGLFITDPSAYYPGDAYVDWVGMDGYNNVQNGWQTFSEVFGFSYGQLVSAHVRPLMICEWGASEDARKAAWFTSALVTEIPKFFPLVKALVYFNLNQVVTLGLGANWPVVSDEAARTSYAAGVASAYYLVAVP